MANFSLFAGGDGRRRGLGGLKGDVSFETDLGAVRRRRQRAAASQPGAGAAGRAGDVERLPRPTAHRDSQSGGSAQPQDGKA